MERNRFLLLTSFIAALLAACSGYAVAPNFGDPLHHSVPPARLKPETVGFILYDLKRGQVLEQYNRRTPFIPASTTKLLTVGAALDILGPDYRFNTDLAYRGHIRNGTLTGDLILIGGDDPELHVRDLLKMIAALHEKGVHELRGRFLYVEESAFRRDRIDSIMDEEAAYNPAIGSLSLESNVVFLHWKRKGNLPDAYLLPDLPGIDLTIKDRDPTEQDDREVVFQGGESWAMLRPKQPEGWRPLPVKDAGSYTARVFRLLCLTRGIHLPPPAAETEGGGRSLLARHESRPLREIAAQILATSDNPMTEQLLFRLAEKKAGHPLDLASSAALLREHLISRIGGLDATGLQLKNGSGLTSENLITPEQLVAGLLYTDAVAGPGGIEPLLPVGGWSQGLLGRLNRPPESFRVVAKPGGIYYSVTLCGFLYPASGRRMAFAIMISDRRLRAEHEAEKNRRSRSRNVEALAWMKRNRDTLDGILTEWIAKY